MAVEAVEAEYRQSVEIKMTGLSEQPLWSTLYSAEGLDGVALGRRHSLEYPWSTDYP